METVKRLALSLALMSVLAIAALADDPNPPCAPGETHSPPCSSQSVTDGSTAPGETQGPPVSNTVDVISIAEAARWSLSLF